MNLQQQQQPFIRQRTLQRIQQRIIELNFRILVLRTSRPWMFFKFKDKKNG
jgi:hypothetical protein